jgi:hypothetical protein
MYLKYGSHQHEPGECTVVITRENVYSESRVLKATRERWEVQGRLQAADQAAVKAAVTALEAAYSQDGHDLGFWLSSGSATMHSLVSASCDGGTKVVRPPSYPDSARAECSTFRTYALTVEGLLRPSDGLVSWTEKLRFRGTCGPSWGFLPVLTGIPPAQIFRQATTMQISQSGYAVGLGEYPVAPPPLWPEAEHQDRRDIDLELPTDGSRQRRTSWSYVMETNTPVTGQPTTSPLNL